MYGVIRGRLVPAEFIEVFPLSSGARELVPASDGYPVLGDTLERSEEYLAALLLGDPHCVGALRSTKGLVLGNLPIDDRAWVRRAL